MNKKTIITILLALVAMAGQGQVPLESVKELTMKSEYFNHERQVLIYTPNNYPNFDQTYYDVIYVFHLAFSLRHPQDHQQNPQRDHFRQRLAPDLIKTLYLG